MKKICETWSPKMRRMVAEAIARDETHARELRGRHSRREALPRAPFAIGPSFAIAPVCVAVQSTQRSKPMLNENEKVIISRFAGVSAEAFAGKRGAGERDFIEKRKNSPYPDNTDRFEPHDAADGDEGYPSSDDDSVEAHIARCRNHLEAATDGDTVDMDRIASARDCLSAALAKHGGTHSMKKVGLRFV